MARPKSENPLSRVVAVRLDEESHGKLQEKAGNQKVSEYIRNVVEKELEA